MTLPSFTLANARLVLPDAIVTGSLAVEDGRIAEIARGRDFPGATDCAGDYLLPGLVELHTDNLEKHMMPRVGVDWPALSAVLSHDGQVAAAGITTVFDAVAVGDTFGRPDRHVILEKAVDALSEAIAADVLRAEHFLHVRCEVAHPQMMSLFERFGDGDLVRLVSLMDHTPGARQYADIERYVRQYSDTHRQSRDAALALIAERQAISEAHAGRHRAAVAAAAHARGLVLASHDDANTDHIDEAAGLGVSISEFPTTLEAARAARAKGLATIMGAPNVVRGKSHSGNVAAADLARQGLLDALSSDYMPVSLLQAPFKLAADLGLSLCEAIGFVTANPARMAGLEDRGRLCAGLRADLIRVQIVSETPVVRAVWRAGGRIA